MMVSRKQHCRAFIDYFQQHLPAPTTELVYTTPFELLVAVVLSAQCTDRRVNQVTPALFHAFPTVAALADAAPEVVFEYIRSVSYPNNKAKYLVGMARRVRDRHGGHLPRTRETLMQLPGVGRKTANVLLATLFNEPTIAVDTHVARVSKRLGLVSKRATTPLAIEKELMRHVPREYAHHVNHWLVLFGRYSCKAIKPHCGVCPFQATCPYYHRYKGLNRGNAF